MGRHKDEITGNDKERRGKMSVSFQIMKHKKRNQQWYFSIWSWKLAKEKKYEQSSFINIDLETQQKIVQNMFEYKRM